MAGSYCCFVQPVKSYELKELTDVAPSGHQYGFPIFNAPKTIGQYEVLESKGRGYYGATYVVKGRFNRKRILKVIPKAIYELHEKSFEEECDNHAKVAEGSFHIVQIEDAFETNVSFPNVAEIECHIAVLSYVHGDLLKQYLDSKRLIPATRIAQISMDLLNILNELDSKEVNHNDLHPENLIVEELEENTKRHPEFDKYIKVVAIDLGSLTGESLSWQQTRKGDKHWVAEYISLFSQNLLSKEYSDINSYEYRLAFQLDGIARVLFPKSANQRVNYNDLISEIRKSARNTYAWNEKLTLNTFADLYNAQQMEASHIPSLLVDPDNKWVNDISEKGALVITGMRGCGKTMLLRALEFHARAVPNGQQEQNDIEAIRKRLKEDNYVGIYVSSSKLLDKLGKSVGEPIFEPYSRLFIAFCIQALKAINHLKEIDIESVKPNYYQDIKELISRLIADNSILDNVESEETLQKRLVDIISSLGKEESKYRIDLKPLEAFPLLAEAIINCSSLWSNKRVYFLLDDVSTRYFDDSNVSELLSALIFHSEICSFKITSEAQTIQLMLHAPGKIANAKEGRDIVSYDLGQVVYDKIKDDFRQGKKFIERILIKRTEHFPGHPAPNLTPSQLLGDITLDQISENISEFTEQKGSKNEIYHGISALVGLCVGDIGEIVNLYERMLRKYRGKYPLPPEDQSANFRNISSTAIWHLGRVKADLNLKEYALTFAETAYELLKKSAKERPNEDYRLRQYYSIYVDIKEDETIDKDELYNQLIELIDAGIFVFSGGSDSPRTTNRFKNPLTQFVLIYRKLYGVTNLMGLVHGDRFELSGSQLMAWLSNPTNGEILKKGLGTGKYKRKDKEDYKIPKQKKKKSDTGVQATIFKERAITKEELENRKQVQNFLLEKIPSIIKIKNEDQISVDKAVIGLGFEERTQESARRVIDLNPKSLQFIEFKEEGRKEEILNMARKSKIPFEIVKSSDIDKVPPSEGNILIDISGLSKNLIFHSVRREFRENEKVFIYHTKPEIILPKDEQVDELLSRRDNEEDLDFEFLQHLTSELSKGESGPYTVEKLTETNSDDTNNRLLLAFSSPKYERVLRVLDDREFDFLQIISRKSGQPRDELARIAADLITRRFSYSHVEEFDTDDMSEFLKYLTEKYFEFHVINGYNIEFALTGSKRHTVVAAIVDSLFQVSKSWYVRPNKWDQMNFSEGIGKSECFEISFS